MCQTAAASRCRLLMSGSDLQEKSDAPDFLWVAADAEEAGRCGRSLLADADAPAEEQECLSGTAWHLHSRITTVVHCMYMFQVILRRPVLLNASSSRMDQKGSYWAPRSAAT